MRTHLVLLFLGFMSVVKAQSSDRQAISDALQLQDYPRALSLLEQLPEGTESKRKMAYCHYQLGNWKAAKESYLTVLKDDSLDIQSHLYLGIIYDQEYDLPKAILHYRRLSTIDSTNTTYLKALAKTYEKAGLTADALKLYEKVHGMNDQDITALLNLATIWLDLKEFAIADSLSSLAFELDTNNLQVILTKARSQYSLKSYEEAVHFFERTRGHIDLNPFYQKMLGYAYLQIDSIDKAIFVLSNLLYKEQSEYTYSYLAKAHAQKEEWDQAISFYEQAVKAGLSENLEQYHLALAKLNKDHGHLKEVIYHFDEAYHYSDNPDYIFYKAQATENYYADKNMAMDQYRRYLRLVGDDGQFADYANDRIRLLKEYIHQSR